MLFSNVFVGLSAVIAFTGYAAGSPVPETGVIELEPPSATESSEPEIGVTPPSATGSLVPETPVTAFEPPAAIYNATMFNAPVDYANCSALYNGCGSEAIYKDYKREDKRKLAYYADYEGTPGGAEFNEAQLEGLTNLVLFQVDARKLPLEFPVNTNQAPKDIVKRARDKKIAVSAAFGGWDVDWVYKNMTTSKHAEVMGEHIAAFAVANNFDGVSFTAKQYDILLC